MNKLSFSIVYSGAILSACSFTEKPVKELKPNLLFIFTDQQATGTMAVYGNEKIKTPNLNKLANESYVFKNAYTTYPVCSPNRGSIMTGLYPLRHGVTWNDMRLADSIKCFPELVNDPTYNTGYMGKWHLGNEVFAQHGFNSWVSIEEYTGGFSPGRDRKIRSDYHNWLISKGYKPDNQKNNTFSRAFASTLPLESSKPKFLEENAVRFLEENKNQPFILYVNFLEPHPPINGPLDSMYNPAEVDFPPNFDLPGPETGPGGEKYKVQNGGNKERLRKLKARYWGLVTEVDLSVGVILDKLHALGLDENTIVVFTSDHGEMMGAHQLFNKVVMYQESVKIPLLIKIPQKIKKQVIIEKPISQIDLVPTLLDLMNKEIPGYLQGKSLLSLMNGDDENREYIVIQQLNPEWGVYRVVITKDLWKLVIFKNDKNQLFNLNEDPYEMKNLYNLDNQNKIQQMYMQLKEWQIQNKDTTIFSGPLMNI